MVREKGLEPPRAFAHQDLNLGRLVPSSPVLSQCVRFLGGFRGLWARFIPSSPVLHKRVGLQLGCSGMGTRNCCAAL